MANEKRAHKESLILTGMRQALAHASGELQEGSYRVTTANQSLVRAVRKKLGLSQSQFADAFGINLRTLQEWEQGRSQPTNEARALFTIVYKEPKAAMRAMGHKMPARAKPRAARRPKAA